MDQKESDARFFFYLYIELRVNRACIELGNIDAFSSGSVPSYRLSCHAPIQKNIDIQILLLIAYKSASAGLPISSFSVNNITENSRPFLTF